jgi:hypothetical protein
VTHRLIGPFEAGIEERQTEQAADGIEQKLKGAAPIIGEAGRDVERLSFRRGDRLVGPLIQALGEFGDGRVQIDFPHRHSRHTRTLPDAGAEARHQ